MAIRYFSETVSSRSSWLLNFVWNIPIGVVFFMYKGEISKLCFKFLYMFQVLVLWPDVDLSLESKLVAVKIKLFTSRLVVIVNIYRYWFIIKLFRNCELHSYKFAQRSPINQTSWCGEHMQYSLAIGTACNTLVRKFKEQRPLTIRMDWQTRSESRVSILCSW